jgi:hypothetical protein
MSRRCWQLEGVFDVKGETVTVLALRNRRKKCAADDDITVVVTWRDVLRLPQRAAWEFKKADYDRGARFPRFTAALLQLVLRFWERAQEKKP